MYNYNRKQTAIVCRLQRVLNGYLEQRATEALGENYKQRLVRIIKATSHMPVGTAVDRVLHILAFCKIQRNELPCKTGELVNPVPQPPL